MNNIVTKEELLEEIYDINTNISTKVIDNKLKKIPKKLLNQMLGYILKRLED